MNNTEHSVTGYPSKDKQWLKYYTTEVINDVIPTGSIYDRLRLNNGYVCDIRHAYLYAHAVVLGAYFGGHSQIQCGRFGSIYS